jgi:hypothetical protein
MASANEAGFNLREIIPLPRKILSTCEVMAHENTGQRTNLRVTESDKDFLSSPKDEAGNLVYPVSVRDSAESGLGCRANRCLSHFNESTLMNVGGSHWNVKASSLLMSSMSVGGAIVVGGWESQPQGEGHQEGNASLYLLAAIAPGIVWDEP